MDSAAVADDYCALLCIKEVHSSSTKNCQRLLIWLLILYTASNEVSNHKEFIYHSLGAIGLWCSLELK